jgi:zinc transport system substrate-binding protein
MRYFIIILTALLAAACGSKQGADGERPVIAVTVEPQRYFAEAIAGDKFNVVSMVPKGSSPETYDPTPRQLLNLSRSVAYLRIGYIAFELTWMEKLQSNAPGMAVFDTSKGVELIADEEPHQHGEADDHEAAGHHHHGGVEPHIWNSARNALIIARNTLSALVELDKENSQYYTARYDSLCRVIRSTDDTITRMLQQEQPAGTFMIYHPALSYFARDYGLRQISIEEGGKSPSPAHMKQLVETCRTEGVKVIFVQPEFDKRNAEVIASEAGLRVVDVNPLNYNWPDEMINVAKALTINKE